MFLKNLLCITIYYLFELFVISHITLSVIFFNFKKINSKKKIYQEMFQEILHVMDTN